MCFASQYSVQVSLFVDVETHSLRRAKRHWQVWNRFAVSLQKQSSLLRRMRNEGRLHCWLFSSASEVAAWLSSDNRFSNSVIQVNFIERRSTKVMDMSDDVSGACSFGASFPIKNLVPPGRAPRVRLCSE